MTHTFLRRSEVERQTGLSRSSIYRAMSEKRFPRPIPIGRQAVAWLESQVIEWQQAKIDGREWIDRSASTIDKPNANSKGDN